jgi:hypothetical protein
MGETCWSRRIIIIASILFLLVLSPIQSQIPSPSQTPIQRVNPGLIRIKPLPPAVTASPTIPRRPPFPNDALSPNVPLPPTATVAPRLPALPPIIERIQKLANTATLKVNPRSVKVGQSVQFELVFPQPLSSSPSIQYGFDFGDGSRMEWTSNPRTAHGYLSPRTYETSAVIRVRARGRVLDSRKIVGPQVAIVARSSPTRSATAPVPTRPSPFSPSATAIAAGGSITSTPPTRSNNVASPTATRSLRNRGTVTPSPIVSNGRPSPKKRSWLLYIVSAGLALLMLAYLMFPRSKPRIPSAPRPTFHPHPDWDEPQKPPENVTINYQLCFNANVSDGEHRIETDGPTLILRKAKQ